eukprot:jgi/Mesvir1/4014/Mv03706-RA.2
MKLAGKFAAFCEVSTSLPLPLRPVAIFGHASNLFRGAESVEKLQLTVELCRDDAMGPLYDRVPFLLASVLRAATAACRCQPLMNQRQRWCWEKARESLTCTQRACCQGACPAREATSPPAAAQFCTRHSCSDGQRDKSVSSSPCRFCFLFKPVEVLQRLLAQPQGQVDVADGSIEGACTIEQADRAHAHIYTCWLQHVSWPMLVKEMWRATKATRQSHGAGCKRAGHVQHAPAPPPPQRPQRQPQPHHHEWRQQWPQQQQQEQDQRLPRPSDEPAYNDTRCGSGSMSGGLLGAAWSAHAITRRLLGAQGKRRPDPGLALYTLELPQSEPCQAHLLRGFFRRMFGGDPGPMALLWSDDRRDVGSNLGAAHEPERLAQHIVEELCFLEHDWAELKQQLLVLRAMLDAMLDMSAPVVGPLWAWMLPALLQHPATSKIDPARLMCCVQKLFPGVHAAAPMPAPAAIPAVPVVAGGVGAVPAGVVMAAAADAAAAAAPGAAAGGRAGASAGASAGDSTSTGAGDSTSTGVGDRAADAAPMAGIAATASVADIPVAPTPAPTAGADREREWGEEMEEGEGEGEKDDEESSQPPAKRARLEGEHHGMDICPVALASIGAMSSPGPTGAVSERASVESGCKPGPATSGIISHAVGVDVPGESWPGGSLGARVAWLRAHAAACDRSVEAVRHQVSLARLLVEHTLMLASWAGMAQLPTRAGVRRGQRALLARVARLVAACGEGRDEGRRKGKGQGSKGQGDKGQDGRTLRSTSAATETLVSTARATFAVSAAAIVTPTVTSTLSSTSSAAAGASSGSNTPACGCARRLMDMLPGFYRHPCRDGFLADHVFPPAGGRGTARGQGQLPGGRMTGDVTVTAPFVEGKEGVRSEAAPGADPDRLKLDTNSSTGGEAERSEPTDAGPASMDAIMETRGEGGAVDEAPATPAPSGACPQQAAHQRALLANWLTLLALAVPDRGASPRAQVQGYLDHLGLTSSVRVALAHLGDADKASRAMRWHWRQWAFKARAADTDHSTWQQLPEELFHAIVNLL